MTEADFPQTQRKLWLGSRFADMALRCCSYGAIAWVMWKGLRWLIVPALIQSFDFPFFGLTAKGALILLCLIAAAWMLEYLDSQPLKTRLLAAGGALLFSLATLYQAGRAAAPRWPADLELSYFGLAYKKSAPQLCALIGRGSRVCSGGTGAIDGGGHLECTYLRERCEDYWGPASSRRFPMEPPWTISLLPEEIEVVAGMLLLPSSEAETADRRRLQEAFAKFADSPIYRVAGVLPDFSNGPAAALDFAATRFPSCWNENRDSYFCHLLRCSLLPQGGERLRCRENTEGGPGSMPGKTQSAVRQEK